MTHHDVDKFFDAISDDYTQKIERCFPRYREMLCALLHCLPSDNRGASILELGCGTGNLSLLLTQMFPSAKIWFVDISSESLQTCRQRVGASRQYSFENTDIRDLVFDEARQEVSQHHLPLGLGVKSQHAPRELTISHGEGFGELALERFGDLERRCLDRVFPASQWDRGKRIGLR